MIFQKDIKEQGLFTFSIKPIINIGIKYFQRKIPAICKLKASISCGSGHRTGSKYNLLINNVLMCIHLKGL